MSQHEFYQVTQIQPFDKVLCLSEKVFSYNDLLKKWNCSKGRYKDDSQRIQTFINFNKKAFDFMGIDASIEEENNISRLRIKTSNYTGAIPLLSPATGKPCGDLIVKPRYGENIADLVMSLKDIITPEYCPNLILCSEIVSNPPIYFECFNYLVKFQEAINCNWRKFTSVTEIQKRPSSSTNWGKYSVTSANPQRAFEYENRRNILSFSHEEWQYLTYVLKLAILEIEDSRTPFQLRSKYLESISKLNRYLNTHPHKEIKELFIHSSDPNTIKALKEIGNRILSVKTSILRAWRLDFADFFEKYIQYVFSQTCINIGATTYNNKRYSIHGNRPAWCLKYLEPDLLVRKGERIITIDAKYKAHMYNSAPSEVLKESFRNDLHQVIAYSAFTGENEKFVFLVYPDDKFTKREMNINSNLSSAGTKIMLIGVPVDFNKLTDTKSQLLELLKESFQLRSNGN